jgi:hypothetical protein
MESPKQILILVLFRLKFKHGVGVGVIFSPFQLAMLKKGFEQNLRARKIRIIAQTGVYIN